MFSVRYTGTNFLPLCTASVWPTISGTTVERRDQVLMTFFSLARFIDSTFSSRCVSTNGPFFSERLITSLDEVYGRRSTANGYEGSSRGPWAVGRGPLLFRPPLHDEFVARLTRSGLVTLRRYAPRGDRMTPTRGLAFAAAEGVIDRVHRNATHVRALPLPTRPPGLAHGNVFVIE